MDSTSSSSTHSSEEDAREEVEQFLVEFLEEEEADEELEDRIIAGLHARLEACSSRSGRRRRPRRHIERNREDGHERLFADYFSEQPVYAEDIFRRRFRMRRPLFLRIVQALGEWSPYFTERRDCTNRRGLSPLQKCTAAIRMLTYGGPADAVDEYVRIGESTAIDCLKKFVEGVICKFGEEYLRSPTTEDMQCLLQQAEARGFPGMLGSIDCMHWEWRNCPVAWKGQFTRGDYGVPTIILEAVVSYDLWIWHAFFGVAGSNNDINVINQSPLFTDVLKGRAPQVHYTLGAHSYNMGYYLADGIYPEWAVFVKTIPLPQTAKDRLFARHQEGARKDVERAFGVLQSRFAIVHGAARFWQISTLAKIMRACVILHNMIIEDERDYDGEILNFDDHPSTSNVVPPVVHSGATPAFADVLLRNAAIRARPTHAQLKIDLVEHIWQRFGGDHTHE